MVTTDANPMPLVHSVLYRRCTRGIGFASVVTILAPIKRQEPNGQFCRLNRFFSPARPLDLYENVRAIKNLSFFGPPKTGPPPALVLYYAGKIVWSVQMKFAITYIIGDTLEYEDKMYRQSLCCHCSCPINLIINTSETNFSFLG